MSDLSRDREMITLWADGETRDYLRRLRLAVTVASNGYADLSKSDIVRECIRFTCCLLAQFAAGYVQEREETPPAVETGTPEESVSQGPAQANQEPGRTMPGLRGDGPGEAAIRPPAEENMGSTQDKPVGPLGKIPTRSRRRPGRPKMRNL